MVSPDRCLVDPEVFAVCVFNGNLCFCMDLSCLFCVTHQHSVNFIIVLEGQGLHIELGRNLQDEESTLELHSRCLDFLILKESIASLGKLIDHLFLFVLGDVFASGTTLFSTTGGAASFTSEFLALKESVDIIFKLAGGWVADENNVSAGIDKEAVRHSLNSV